MAKKKSKAKLQDILRAYWKGIYPKRIHFFVILVVFIFSQIAYLLIPLLYKRFFDVITTGTGPRSEMAADLFHIILLILALNATGWLLFRAGMFILNGFEAGVMARLKQMAFSYIIDHSHSFFSDTFAGSLVQRINRFSRAFERVMDGLVFSLIQLLVHTIGASIIIWSQNKIIATVIMGWILLVFIINLLFAKWKMKYDLASAEADSTTTARLADTLGNHHPVAAFAGSRFEAEKFKEVSNAQAGAQLKTWNASAILDAVQSGLIFVVEFLLFYFGTKYWIDGSISVGMFILFQIYIISLANRMWDFGRVIRTLYEGYSDSQEAVDMLITPHEIKDSPEAKTLQVAGGEISVRDLTFKYGDLPPVYEGLTLTIPKNQKIALVGHSGSGKSTFVKLLMRLYDINSGSISIDGEDIRSVTQTSLREAIAHVPQDPALFHRTLMENIRYGRRDASDEEVIAAAKLAHCDEFISVLPLKYETFVGERGIKLSGGERQRVAIARAILKNAPILVLDEATSSLDSHSESLIQEAMDELMKGKTVIAIAHRLSTIRKMDRIIVLEGGKIAEDGTHEELTAKKGIYSELWSHQSGGYMKDE